jgi:DnaK suppressor protein
MPAKKASAKPTKAKKTVSARPVAKAAAKARVKPAPKAGAKAATKAKTAPAKPAPKPASKPSPKAHAKVAAPKAASKAAPKAAVGAAAKARPQTAAAKPVVMTTSVPPVLAASLLSGPRNVEPYVPRKGEEYMSKEQLDHFRTILSSWKQDLMQEVDRTMLHMKDEAANFPDPNDRATQESEFSLELRTRDRERKLIRKIDEALKRIEDGSYGFCLETGEPIGVKRLEARPVATLSVEAQERRERREKQFGDRDDWYR